MVSVSLARDDDDIVRHLDAAYQQARGHMDVFQEGSAREVMMLNKTIQEMPAKDKPETVTKFAQEIRYVGFPKGPDDGPGPGGRSGNEADIAAYRGAI